MRELCPDEAAGVYRKLLAQEGVCYTGSGWGEGWERGVSQVSLYFELFLVLSAPTVLSDSACIYLGVALTPEGSHIPVAWPLSSLPRPLATTNLLSELLNLKLERGGWEPSRKGQKPLRGGGKGTEQREADGWIGSLALLDRRRYLGGRVGSGRERESQCLKRCHPQAGCTWGWVDGSVKSTEFSSHHSHL